MWVARYIKLRLMRASWLIRVIVLRIFGVKADWSAIIDWSAVIERSGGEIIIGPNTFIDRGVILRAFGGKMVIGSKCRINPYSFLSGGGSLSIGDGVSIAAHTVIVASNHIFSDPNSFIVEQGETRLGVSIEDDVWLGAGVRVLDGVTIRKGSVVGAGAVVSKSTEPYDVVVGVPARKIMTRRIFSTAAL